ncbi:MAG: hypothetical protein Q9198_009526, partial [Flavoplaca austrocitrina]
VSRTIAGLGAYFLGLLGLSNSLKDDDLTEAQKLNGEPQDRPHHNNFADTAKCPAAVPDNFKDGDEVACKPDEATPTEEVCVQFTSGPDKLQQHAP